MPSRKLSGTKIGVIGTINRDTIYRADNSIVKSWGGILYNINYLCEDSDATVIPVVNIGKDCHKQLESHLRQFNDLDRSNIARVDSPNNHCVLYYSDQSEKQEILKGGVPSLNYRQVKGLLECDAVLVNFISGRDIKLAVLERFRREYNDLIYIDIHSLTLGRRAIKGGFTRFLRKPRYWRRYIACADIVQVNRVEFELLAECEFNRQSAVCFFKRELPRAKGLIITLGADGCVVVYRRDKIIGRHIKAPQIEAIIDTTGCGDIFSAGFLVEFLKSGSFTLAAKEGNRLAAERCQMQGRFF